MSKLAAGMLLIGIGVGYYLPNFPEPISIINPYIGLALIIIGVAVLLKA